jgi:hypothetical protein
MPNELKKLMVETKSKILESLSIIQVILATAFPFLHIS